MSKVSITELSFDNKSFWRGFFLFNFQYGYDDETDTTIEELADYVADKRDFTYWDSFTGWYDGVFDENDGFVDDPAYIEEPVHEGQILRIEFHPGDTIYMLNGSRIGSTGPHYELNCIPFEDIVKTSSLEHGEILFWLCLPMGNLTVNKKEDGRQIIEERIRPLIENGIFESSIREKLINYILCQIVAS